MKAISNVKFSHNTTVKYIIKNEKPEDFGKYLLDNKANIERSLFSS